MCDCDYYYATTYIIMSLCVYLLLFIVDDSYRYFITYLIDSVLLNFIIQKLCLNYDVFHLVKRHT